MILVDKLPPGNPSSIDGFICCWCAAWFPWSGVGAFTPLGPGRALRWCDSCADTFERIVNPPTFWERAA